MGAENRRKEPPGWAAAGARCGQARGVALDGVWPARGVAWPREGRGLRGARPWGGAWSLGSTIRARPLSPRCQAQGAGRSW